jgi:hypothetical protein
VRTQPRHRQPFAHLTLALVVVDVAAVGGIIVTWMVTSVADSPPHATPPAPTASNSPSTAPERPVPVRPVPVRPGPSSSGSSAPSAGISSSDDERARINATTRPRSRGLPRSTPTTDPRPVAARLDAAGALRHQGKSVAAAVTALDAGPVLEALPAPKGSVAPSTAALPADQRSKPARPESPPARPSPTVPPLTTIQDTDRAPRSAGPDRPAYSSASGYARCPVDPDAAGATWSMPLTLQHTEPRSGEPAPAEAWTAGADGIKDDAPPRARRGVVPYALDHQEGRHRRRGLL